MINFCLLTDKSNAVLVAPPTSGPLKSSLGKQLSKARIIP